MNDVIQVIQQKKLQVANTKTIVLGIVYVQTSIVEALQPAGHSLTTVLVIFW